MAFTTVILSEAKDLLLLFGKMQIPRVARNDTTRGSE